MKYAINYRRMHNGIHGLLIFNTRKKAEYFYDELKGLTEEYYLTECNISNNTHGELEVMEEILWERINESIFHHDDEVNYRELQDVMNSYSIVINTLGYCSLQYINLTIINECALDLYI